MTAVDPGNDTSADSGGDTSGTLRDEPAEAARDLPATPGARDVDPSVAQRLAEELTETAEGHGREPRLSATNDDDLTYRVHDTLRHNNRETPDEPDESD